MNLEVAEAMKIIQEEGREMSKEHAERNLFGDLYDPYEYYNFTIDERDVTEFDSIPLVRRNAMHARKLREIDPSSSVAVVSGLCILPRSRQEPPYEDLPSMQLVQGIRAHESFDEFSREYFSDVTNFVVIASREYREITGNNTNSPDFDNDFNNLVRRLHRLAFKVPSVNIVDTENESNILEEIKSELKADPNVSKYLDHYDGRSMEEREQSLSVPSEVIQEGILDTAATIYYPLKVGNSTVIVLGSFNEMQSTELLRNSGLYGVENIHLVPFVYSPDIINPYRPMHSAGTPSGLLSKGDYENPKTQKKIRDAAGHCKGGKRGLLRYMISSPQISDEQLHETISSCPLYTGVRNKRACRSSEENVLYTLEREFREPMLPEIVQSVFGPDGRFRI